MLTSYSSKLDFTDSKLNIKYGFANMMFYTLSNYKSNSSAIKKVKIEPFRVLRDVMTARLACHVVLRFLLFCWLHPRKCWAVYPATLDKYSNNKTNKVNSLLVSSSVTCHILYECNCKYSAQKSWLTQQFKCYYQKPFRNICWRMRKPN